MDTSTSQKFPWVPLAGVILSLAVLLFAIVMFTRSGHRLNASLVEALADFEEITGSSLDALSFTSKSIVGGWWQEYRMETTHYDRLVEMATQLERVQHEPIAGPDTDAQSEQREREKERLEVEILTYCSENGHPSLNINEVLLLTRRGFTGFLDEYNCLFFSRRFSPTDSDTERQGFIVFAGWLPKAVHESLPPNGSLRSTHAIAEVRQYTDWTGNIVSLDTLKAAAINCFPDPMLFDALGLTAEQRERFQRDVIAAKDEHTLAEILRKNNVRARSGARYVYYGPVALYLNLMEEGRMPFPSAIAPEMSDYLRVTSYPGKQEIPVASVRGKTFDGLAPLQKYATRKEVPLGDVAGQVDLALRAKKMGIMGAPLFAIETRGDLPGSCVLVQRELDNGRFPLSTILRPSGVSFFRHGRSINPMCGWVGRGVNCSPRPVAHRLDEPDRAIPWPVALQQSRPPFHPATVTLHCDGC